MRRWLAIGIGMFLLAGAVGAQEEAVPGPSVEPEALAILKRGTAFISSAKSLRVTVRTVYDRVQESGQKLQFGTVGETTLRRPDRFAVSTERDDGSRRRVYYDGATLTTFDVDENVYGQFPVPPTIDETLDFLELEVGATLPLADLFYSDLSHLGEAAREGRVVGTSRVANWTCDQLAFRGESIDFQVWVERGDEPRVRKIVITYLDLPGEPQFGAFFLKWELGIATPDTVFKFEPPQGAERIPTLARPVGAASPEIR